MAESNPPFRGDNFTRWLLTICAGLIGSGVVALWQMSSHLSALDERMAGWTRSITEQITNLQNKDTETLRQVTADRERVTDDEKHIYRNDNRIDELARRMELIERQQYKILPP